MLDYIGMHSALDIAAVDARLLPELPGQTPVALLLCLRHGGVWAWEVCRDLVYVPSICTYVVVYVVYVPLSPCKGLTLSLPEFALILI